MKKMSSIYKLTWGKGFSKLINLRTVSSVYQYKNNITIKYNFTSGNGLIVFGSGFLEKEPHKEVITFENEECTTEQFNHIENLMKKL